MPEEGENRVSFQNYHKQMKTPYGIYADFKALVKKFQRCEQKEGIESGYTEKTEWHEACGYAYTIIRSDSVTFKKPKVYRGENAVESFLMEMIEMEVLLRKSLAILKPLVMTQEDQ